MARKPRIQFEGAIYHVTTRGVERRPLFDDDRDRGHFVERLADGVGACGVRLYLFCLMGNHFHLLVETPCGNLSAFMHKVQTAHTVFYNLRHGRSGHLLQGRYGATPVQGDLYLGRLSRYIHLNPVRTAEWDAGPAAARADALRAYRWSSYRGYAGLDGGWGFVDEGPVLAAVGGGGDAERRAAYRAFVEGGLAERDEEVADLLGDCRWGIGDDGFRRMVRQRHTELASGARRREDVAFRRAEGRLAPGEVESVVAEGFGLEAVALRRRPYGGYAGAVAARMLVRYAGMSQRAAAARLDASGAAVSARLAVLRERVGEDAELAATVAAIASRLDRMVASKA